MIESVVLWTGVLLALVGLSSILWPLRFLGIRSRAAGAAVLVAGLLVVGSACLLPIPEHRVAAPASSLDELAPHWQFDESHSIRIAAAPGRTFAAIEKVSAGEITFFNTLTAIRRMGRAGRGDILDAPLREPILEVATRTSFMMLTREPPREIVIGTLLALPEGRSAAALSGPTIAARAASRIDLCDRVGTRLCWRPRPSEFPLDLRATMDRLGLAGAGDARRGILLVLVTMFLFCSMDATGKYLLPRYGLATVIWYRFVFHLATVALAAGPRLPRALATRRLGLQLLRSALLVATTFLFFAGLRHLPLATASAIMFASPLLVTAFSVPLLGEKVGIRRWIGIAVGFIGALIIIRPGSAFMQTAALLPLLGAVCNALYQVTTRQLNRTDPAATTLFYSAVIGALAASLILPFEGTWPNLPDAGLLAGMGVLGALGHFTLIRGLHAAAPATVAPFMYTNLIWAVLLGYVIWGDLPDRWSLLGGAVIVGSGLYVFHRERILETRRAAAPPAVRPAS